MYPFPSLFAAGSKVGSLFDAYGHVHPSAMFPPAGVLLYCLWRFEQPRRIDEPSLQRHMLALLRTMYPTNVCLSFVPHPSTLASCRTHPPLFLAVSKMANGSGSADLEQSVGFGSCCGFLFRMRAHGRGCDVPMEWLMPHGAAQGRYVRPTNACCLPKLPVSPFHLCF